MYGARYHAIAKTSTCCFVYSRWRGIDFLQSPWSPKVCLEWVGIVIKVCNVLPNGKNKEKQGKTRKNKGKRGKTRENHSTLELVAACLKYSWIEILFSKTCRFYRILVYRISFVGTDWTNSIDQSFKTISVIVIEPMFFKT